MWVLFARAPPPDAPYWPGRRWLAAVDALAWPGLIVLALNNVPSSGGLFSALTTAFLVASAVGRLRMALLANHRYHFTAKRWVPPLVRLLLIGMLLRMFLGDRP